MCSLASFVSACDFVCSTHLQAQLRAHVFTAIEEQEQSTDDVPAVVNETVASKRLSQLTSHPQSMLMLELIKEWMEFYELDYTNSTMIAEAKLPSHTAGAKDRQVLLSSLNLPNASMDRPILVELLLQAQGQPTAASAASALAAHSPNSSFTAYSQPSSKLAPITQTQSQPAISVDLAESRSRPLSPEEVSPQTAASRSRGTSSKHHEPTDDDAEVSPSSLSSAHRLGVPRRSFDASSTGYFDPPSPTRDDREDAQSPSADTTHGSSRRRRDRNLDMAAVHTLVQTPTHGGSSALPASLATNRGVLHPPPDVPHIELAEGSDLEASGTSIDHSSSIDMDKARLAEVNRMIKSYESQIPKVGGANAEEDDDDDGYEDEEFVASDAGEVHADADADADGVEEGIEVEEDLAGSKVDDSLDGEYFNSSSSVADRKQPAASHSTNSRRSQLPPMAATYSPDQSTDSVDYDDRDPHDVYSEDASVHEPLEAQYDYTEEVEHF